MNELLQTRAHLIFCCRVKEKVVQAKGANGKNEIVNEGFVVVQEKMFIYEMTVSLMLAEGNHIPTILKCPGDLLHAFPEGSKITPKIGEAVRSWSDTGKDIDEAFEMSKRAGMQAANGGMKSLSTWWGSLDKADQHRLANLKDTLKSVAEASDQMRSDQMEAGGGDVGERLAHAKSISKGAESGEGFNREFVTNQLKTLSSEPDTGEQGASEPPFTDADADAWVLNSVNMLIASAMIGGDMEIMRNQYRVVKQTAPEWVDLPTMGRVNTVSMFLAKVMDGEEEFDKARIANLSKLNAEQINDLPEVN